MLGNCLYIYKYNSVTLGDSQETNHARYQLYTLHAESDWKEEWMAFKVEHVCIIYMLSGGYSGKY